MAVPFRYELDQCGYQHFSARLGPTRSTCHIVSLCQSKSLVLFQSFHKRLSGILSPRARRRHVFQPKFTEKGYWHERFSKIQLSNRMCHIAFLLLEEMLLEDVYLCEAFRLLVCRLKLGLCNVIVCFTDDHELLYLRFTLLFCPIICPNKMI